MNNRLKANILICIVYLKSYIVVSLLFYFIFNVPSVLAFNNPDPAVNNIPNVLISFDPDNEIEYAIVVEKMTQKLFLYAFDGTFQLLFSFKCATGEVPGAKLRSGDRKTPEGVYFFLNEYIDENLDPIYGTRAYPMDYPHIFDQVAGLKGYSIWLHGTNRPIIARSSNGCIALANNDINKLSKYITLNRTPIIIVDKIKLVSVNSINRIKNNLLKFINQWNQTLEKGTFKEFIKYYDSEYSIDLSWWPEWDNVRTGLTKSKHPFSVEIKKISILKNNKIYVAVFDQVFKSSGRNQYTGTKKLFFSHWGGKFRIIGDVYQYFPVREKEDIDIYPVVFAGKHQWDMLTVENEIAMLIDRWLKAWSSRDIDTYGSCYASDFRFKKMGLPEWLEYKKNLNQKYSYIHVSIDNLIIKIGKTNKATFVQHYKSSNYESVGVKELIFKREVEQWKIYRETSIGPPREPENILSNSIDTKHASATEK